MRNLILIISIFCISFSSPAQTILPLENYYAFFKTHSKIPKGTYIKDVNHILNKYKGTWKGTYQGNQYLIHIKTTTRAFLGIQLDALILNFKITTPAGEVKVNTLNSSLEDAAAKGAIFKKDNPNVYKLAYASSDNDRAGCGDQGQMYIELTNQNTQLKLYVVPMSLMWGGDDCPNGTFTPPFPNEVQTPMLLTKVK